MVDLYKYENELYDKGLNFIAVSYTHLDVYKRQVGYRIMPLKYILIN